MGRCSANAAVPGRGVAPRLRAACDRTDRRRRRGRRGRTGAGPASERGGRPAILGARPGSVAVRSDRQLDRDMELSRCSENCARAGNRPSTFACRVFWLAFLAAGCCRSGPVRSGLEPWVLVACAVAGVIVLGNLAGVNPACRPALTPSLTVLGLCFGHLPGIVGLSHAVLPHPGLILGSALGAATLWHLLVDPALTRTLAPWSPRQLMRGTMLVALGLSCRRCLLRCKALDAAGAGDDAAFGSPDREETDAAGCPAGCDAKVVRSAKS